MSAGCLAVLLGVINTFGGFSSVHSLLIFPTCSVGVTIPSSYIAFTPPTTATMCPVSQTTSYTAARTTTTTTKMPPTSKMITSEITLTEQDTVSRINKQTLQEIVNYICNQRTALHKAFVMTKLMSTRWTLAHWIFPALGIWMTVQENAVTAWWKNRGNHVLEKKEVVELKGDDQCHLPNSGIPTSRHFRRREASAIFGARTSWAPSRWKVLPGMHERLLSNERLHLTQYFVSSQIKFKPVHEL